MANWWETPNAPLNATGLSALIPPTEPPEAATGLGVLGSPAPAPQPALAPGLGSFLSATPAQNNPYLQQVIGAYDQMRARTRATAAQPVADIYRNTLSSLLEPPPPPKAPVVPAVPAVPAAPVEAEKPTFDLGNTLSAAGTFLTQIPKSTMGALAQAYVGGDRPDTYPQWARSAIDESARQQQENQQLIEARRAAGQSDSSSESLLEASPSSGFTVASGVTGLGAFLGGSALGSPLAGAGAAMGASGAMGYRMTKAQFLDDAFKALEAKSQKERGRAMTEAEKVKAYQDLEPVASNTGLWEAGPEAIGNLALAAGGGTALGLLGKEAVKKIAANAAARFGVRAAAGAAATGTELLTEGITQYHQGNDQAKLEAYLTGQAMDQAKPQYEGAAGLWQSTQDVAPTVLALTAMMGVMAKGGHMAYQPIEQRLAARRAGEQAIEQTRLTDAALAGIDEGQLTALAGNGRQVLADNPKMPGKTREQLQAAIDGLESDLKQRASGDTLRALLADPQQLTTMRGTTALAGMADPDRIGQLTDAEVLEAEQIARALATTPIPGQAWIGEQMAEVANAYRDAGITRQRMANLDDAIAADAEVAGKVASDIAAVATGNLRQGITPEYARASLDDGELTRRLQAGERLSRNHADRLNPKQQEAVRKGVEALRGERAFRDANPDWHEQNARIRQANDPVEVRFRQAFGKDPAKAIAKLGKAELPLIDSLIAGLETRVGNFQRAGTSAPEGMATTLDLLRQHRDQVSTPAPTPSPGPVDFTAERQRLSELAQQADSQNRQRAIQEREEAFRARQQAENDLARLGLRRPRRTPQPIQPPPSAPQSLADLLGQPNRLDVVPSAPAVVQGPLSTLLPGVPANAQAIRSDQRLLGQGRQEGQPEVRPGPVPSGGNLRLEGSNAQGAQPAGQGAPSEVAPTLNAPASAAALPTPSSPQPSVELPTGPAGTGESRTRATIPESLPTTPPETADARERQAETEAAPPAIDLRGGAAGDKKEEKQPWEITYDELVSAISPKTREDLQRARPILAALFPEQLTEDNIHDPWGIKRAVERGDEIPRVPRVDLSQRHKQSIRAAIARGDAVPQSVIDDYPDLAAPVPTVTTIPSEPAREKKAETEALLTPPTPEARLFPPVEQPNELRGTVQNRNAAAQARENIAVIRKLAAQKPTRARFQAIQAAYAKLRLNAGKTLGMAVPEAPNADYAEYLAAADAVEANIPSWDARGNVVGKAAPTSAPVAPAPSPAPAPVAPVTAPTPKPKRPAIAPLDPATDDILAAIAKLGGLDRQEADRQGIDPADFARRGYRIHRVFTKGGRSFDNMAETLSQYGYPVTEDGRYTANALLDAVRRALAGETVMTPRGLETTAQKNAEADLSRQESLVDDLVDYEAAGFEELAANERITAQLMADAIRDLGENQAEAIFERASTQQQDADPETFNAALQEAFDAVRQRESQAGRAETGPAPTGTPAEEQFLLAGYSREDLAREQEAVARAQAEQEAKDKAAEQKEAADRAGKDFLLTGSTRPADVAMARGQEGLIGAESPQDLNAMFDELLAEELSKVKKPETVSKATAPPVKTGGARKPSTKAKAPARAPATTPRSAGEATTSAAKNVAMGLNDALNGLIEIFGTKGRLSSGLTFDEDAYRRAKPLFQAAVAHFAEAARDVKEAMRLVIQELLKRTNNDRAMVETMKPYVVRFIEDTQNGSQDTEREQPGMGEVAPRGSEAGPGTGRRAGAEHESGQKPVGNLAPESPGNVETPEGGRTGSAVSDNSPGLLLEGIEPTGKGGNAADRRQGTGNGGLATDGIGGLGGAGTDRNDGGTHDDAPVITYPNYHISDPKALVGGSPKTRFAKNRKAIETYRELSETGLQPTPEQLDALAAYTGWGSFGQELFQGTWKYPRPKPGWEDESRWMRDYLGQDEWESAQQSILNAHYTDPPTVTAMWDIARKLGFTGGRVLEPSMGVGNFFGLMPRDMMGASQLTGIELDALTAGIAKLLYPDAAIRQMGYQDSKTADNFYDLIIGNWPFARQGPIDRRYRALSPSLHDYFFLKAVDQVRPGGLVIGITSAFTMDKKGVGIREELAKKAELVAAFRLPTGAFEDYAGTAVVTDILVLKKRETPLGNASSEAWTKLGTTLGHPSGSILWANRYYLDNPDHVLGTMDWGTHTTIGAPGLVVTRPDRYGDRLTKIANKVPAGVYEPRAAKQAISYLIEDTKDRQQSVTLGKDGKLYQVQGERLAPLEAVSSYAVKDQQKTADREAQIRALIGLRRRTNALFVAERDATVGDAVVEERRAGLNRDYHAFVERHGPINESFGLKYLKKLDDPYYPELAALETQRGDRWVPATALQRSTTRRKNKLLDRLSISDALVVARNERLDFDIGRVAELANTTPEQAAETLLDANAIFRAPDGRYEVADQYLSGNVRRKLREARSAQEEGVEGMERNIKALEKAVPKDVPYFHIEARLGASWIPIDVYQQFVKELAGVTSDYDNPSIRYVANSWKVDRHPILNRSEADRFRTNDVSFRKILEAALNVRTITIKRTDSDGNTVVDEDASKEANQKVADVREEFANWVWKSADRQVGLERVYNEIMNATATPQFDGSFLGFEGMVLQRGDDPFNLRQHQINAIYRGLANQRGLYAHEVGTGKTNTIAGIAIESRRYGLARKPLVLAHNANSKSVAESIVKMYPNAKVLYIDNLSSDTIETKLRQIKMDDWDAVVMPHSLIDRLTLTGDTLKELAKEQIDALEEEAYAAAEEDMGSEGEQLVAGAMAGDETALKKLRSPSAKDLVRARNKIIAKIDEQAKRASRENAISFEELGIDTIIVDEAHMFKKPPLETRMKMRGLASASSNRSLALNFLTGYIKKLNNGKGVHLFTGTPITNTLTETFHMMRYVMDDEMRRDGLAGWDAWFNTFASETNDIEVTSAGEYEPVTRLASFINVADLRRMIGTYTDIVFADDMPEFKPRKTASGKTMADDLTDAERDELLDGRAEDAEGRPYKKVIIDTADMTPEQAETLALLVERARTFRQASRKQRRDIMLSGGPESPILVETAAANTGLDHRLFKEEGRQVYEQGASTSKAARAARNILKHYHEHPLATQAVFMERGFDAKGFNLAKTIVDDLVKGGIPRNQIAIVDGSTNADKRKAIIEAVNRAEIRVVIGNTQTLGVGVNMQDNLRAMHHMDAPWTPADLEQRNGRGHRQGNKWNTVLEYRYLTERIDGRRWQVLAVKDRFIKAFLKADENLRVIEGDSVDDSQQSDIVSTLSEAAGDPRILIINKLKADLEKLQHRERMHGRAVVDAKRELERQNEFLERSHQRKTAYEQYRLTAENFQKSGEKNLYVIDGKTFEERQDAQSALDEFIRRKLVHTEGVVAFGQIRGLNLWYRWNGQQNTPPNFYVGERTGARSALIEMGKPTVPSAENAIWSLPRRINEEGAEIAAREQSIANLERIANEPFGRGEELQRKKDQLGRVEKDVQVNPIPPPSWLRNGAPVDAVAYHEGQPYVVTGHRWTPNNYLVELQTADGQRQLSVPYDEVTDQQGILLYEPHPFVAPEIADQKRFAIASLPRETVDALKALASDRLVQDLQDSGQLTVLARQDQLPKTIAIPPGRRVAGAVDPKTGKVYLIAENIAPGEIEGYLLHEVSVHLERLGLTPPKQAALRLARVLAGLVGGRQILGEATFQDVLAQLERMRAAGNPNVAAAFRQAESAMRALGQNLNNRELVAEEALAYLVQDGAARHLPIIRRILAAIRAFLYRAGIRVNLTPDDLLSLARSTLRTAGERQLVAAPTFSPVNPDIRYSADTIGQSEPTLAADELLARVQAGEVSELTPEQWAQVQQAFLGQAATVATGTDAPTFQSWFGNSKIKTRDGKPLVMYHGTSADFTAFNAERSGTATTHPTAALGFFFTNNKSHAAGKYGTNVLEVYLAIDKPYAMTDADLRGIESLEDAKAFRAKLEAKGYDGIVLPAETSTRYVAAFRPDQIKFTSNESYTLGQADMRFAAASPRIQQVVRERGKGALAAVKNVLLKLENPLTGMADLKPYMVERYLTLGRIAEAEAETRQLYDLFRTASETDGRAIYDYLTTQAGDANDIQDEKLRAAARQAKNRIDQLGRAAVERGLISEAAYHKYKDQYLPRLYLRHLLNDDAITRVISNTGKKPDLGWTKQRKDIPESIRRLVLGEIKDPAYLIAHAVGTEGRDMALMDWFERIAQNEHWVLPASLVEWNGRQVTPFWLASEARQIRAQALYYNAADASQAMRLADRMDATANRALANLNIADLPEGWRQLPDSPRYGKLRGMVVRKEIHGDIVGSTSITTDNNLAQAILGDNGMLAKGTSLWKWAKVAANPPAQVRNFISNGVLLHLSGVPFHLVPVRIIQAVREIRTGGAHYQVSRKYGVTESSYTNQELRRIDTDMLDLLARQGKSGWARLHALAGHLMNVTSDLYQFSETVFKTAKIIDAMERQGMNEADAALEAQQALFDYSLVSPSVRYLRNAPLGAPFITFQTKALPALLRTALRHPLRFAPYIALPVVLTAWLAAEEDVDAEDVKALRLALPKWLRERGHAWFLPYRDEKGRMQAMDFGYFLPWTTYADIAQKAVSGKPGEALMTAGLFGSPIVDLVTAIQTGKDPFTNQDLYNKYDPPATQIASMMNYLWRLAMPTFMTDIGVLGPDFVALAEGRTPLAGKLAEATTAKVDRYGQPKTTVPQALFRLMGVNLYPIDPALSRAENLRIMQSEFEKERSRMMLRLKDANLDADERRNLANLYLTDLRARAQEMADYAKASRINPKLQSAGGL